MFRFEDPTYLYLLVLIPILALFRFLLVRRQKIRLRKFGDINLLRELMPDVSKWRPGIKFWLLEIALALLIVIIARPQMGSKINTEKRVGIETIIAMDISNSMRAEDVVPSRLDKSKMLIENMVEAFSNDKIGLIVFAGDAFIQLPITSDYVSAKMFLNSIDPSMIATQGTDIATAINMATNSFTQQEGVGKAILVITDGEDHEGGAVEAAKAAKKKGLNVFVLGVGTTKGAPVPIPESNDYIKDNAGNTVMSVLNEDMCHEIAKAGGGAYIHVDNNSRAQEQLNSELDKLSKQEIASEIYSEYDEQYQAFGIIVFLLLIIEICVYECRNPLLRNITLFGKKRPFIVCVLLFALMPCVNAQTARQHIREGNRLYNNGKYADAEVSYRKSIDKDSRNSQSVYNLGNVLFMQGKDSAAVRQFEEATRLESNPFRKAMSYHNIGVIFQGRKSFAEAIEAYKNALRLNPNDNMTRYNLALCKRQLKKQKEQERQNKNEENKNDNKNKKDKEKQNRQQNQQNKQEDNKMSKDNAEQLLNAAMQQEKDTQQRMKKAMRQPRSRKIQKNW